MGNPAGAYSHLDMISHHIKSTPPIINVAKVPALEPTGKNALDKCGTTNPTNPIIPTAETATAENKLLSTKRVYFN